MRHFHPSIRKSWPVPSFAPKIRTKPKNVFTKNEPRDSVKKRLKIGILFHYLANCFFNFYFRETDLFLTLFYARPRAEVSKKELNTLAAYQQLLAELYTINQEWDHAPEGGFRGGGHAKASMTLKNKKKKKCQSTSCRFMLLMRHMRHVSEANLDHDHGEDDI